MRITMHSLAGVTLIMLLFVALPVAVAHHSVPAIFDTQSIMTVKGTVSDVLWVNPHVYLHFAVKKDGKAEDWVVELGSMNNLDRAGWTRERVKAGDPITITGWRGKAAKNPYLGATVDPSGLPRLLRLKEAEFGDGSKYTVAGQ
jgi:hypothetical protein